MTRQLDYYSSLGVTTSNCSSTIKQSNGLNDAWWLRSPDSSTPNIFSTVNEDGFWSGRASTFAHGVSPAFRIG